MNQQKEPAYMAGATPEEEARLKLLREQRETLTKEIRRIVNFLRVRVQRMKAKEDK